MATDAPSVAAPNAPTREVDEIPWFKVDDSFHVHPKVTSIPRKDRLVAIGLWTMAGTWCAQQLQDGHVGRHMLSEWGATKRIAQVLVASGLWHETETGYVFNDWASWQPTRAAVQERRREDAERKAGWRAAKAAKQDARHGGVPDVSQRDTRVSPGRVPPESRLTRPVPDPTRPDPSSYGLVPEGGLTSVRADTRPPRTCPKHEGMDDPPPCGKCADARKAHDAWQKPTLSAKTTMCGAHPKRRALNCPDCASEVAPPPEDWRQRA